MKRISIFLALALLASPAWVRAQDAATEERLNKLNAQIEVLIEAKDAQNKKIESLANAIEALQQQLNKPSVAYASPEDVKQLAAALKEVDRKRQEDNERILEGIKRELKNFSVAAARSTPPVKTTPPAPDPHLSGEVFEYVVKPGDTLSVIIAAYREKNVKVTLDSILNANPGLKPEKLRVGQKIFIPAPAQ